MDKQTLRGEIATKRRALSQAEVGAKSAEITQRLRTMVPWEKVHKAHCYAPFAGANEVDTRELIRWMQHQGIAVTVPGVVVTADEMEEDYDLIIVPILAFDSSRHRVGFGGGFYDRLLEAHPKAQKLGVAYDFQQVPKIPVEPHDQPLGAVITNSGVI